MLHSGIWCAIDTMAHMHNMSCSGLARHSGLDPTVFNKSKRYNRHGKPHYPSMISVVKILNATGMTLSDFAELVSKCDAHHTRV